MLKQIFILAGANGSGKSTISRELLPTEGVVYINPDDIAREFNPVAHLWQTIGCWFTMVIEVRDLSRIMKVTRG